MFKKLWLTFAQAITVFLALLFVVAAFKPAWLPKQYQTAPLSGAGVPSPQVNLPPRSENQDPGAVALGRGALANSYSSAAQRATPAVVNIFTTKQAKVPQNHPFMNDPLFRRFFGEQGQDGPGGRQPNSSLGSGVIVSADGLVLTNHHVIEAADEVEVLLTDGRRAKAKVIGSDPESDLAVIKVALTGLPTIAFAAVEQAKIGDVVLAIGNPFGVGQTVTMGIVSALGRTQLGINTFENFIQTDAAINPGNSGGALVDVQGNLLGINTAIYSRSGGSLGIGFAIPANTAKQVMEQISKTGAVTRGYIGVEPQDVTPEMAEAFKLPRSDGAIISGIVRNGPADKAGVKTGDILVAVEGKPVKDTPSMLNLIAQLTPEQPARLTFLRDGKEQDINITIGKRPTRAARPKGSTPE
jgi:serine protease DegQ